MRKAKYPFSPELLDALPEELAELFRALEDTLLDEVCSRLKIADQLNEVTVQDIRALRSHGIDLKKIKRAIQKTADVSEEKLNKLLDDVVERNQRYYNDLITLADVTKPGRLVEEDGRRIQKSDAIHGLPGRQWPEDASTCAGISVGLRFVNAANSERGDQL